METRDKEVRTALHDVNEGSYVMSRGAALSFHSDEYTAHKGRDARQPDFCQQVGLEAASHVEVGVGLIRPAYSSWLD